MPPALPRSMPWKMSVSQLLPPPPSISLPTTSLHLALPPPPPHSSQNSFLLTPSSSLPPCLPFLACYLDMNTFPRLVDVSLKLLKVFHHRAGKCQLPPTAPSFHLLSSSMSSSFSSLSSDVPESESRLRRLLALVTCYCSFQTARCNLHAHGGLQT